jgi:hypothetical protein
MCATNRADATFAKEKLDKMDIIILNITNAPLEQGRRLPAKYG